jgi:uncharacterized delta-60 repeat protein
MVFVLAGLAWRAAAWGAPGDLDPTFNGTGTVVTPVLAGGGAAAVTHQSDDKLVATGSVINGTHIDLAVVRYAVDGSLDPTFGGGTGIVTTVVRGGEDQAQAIIQQADGKLVVAGISFDAGYNTSTITLVRYLGDGSLDPAFGGGTGKVTTQVGPDYDGATALLQQADGKLVVAGFSGTDIAVARYLAGGGLDPSFNGTGVVVTTVGVQATANAIIEQAGDHKLVIAGVADASAAPADADIVLVRYDPDGTPDTTFGGGDGIVTTSVGSGDAEARALLQQAGDGKLVVAGVSHNGVDEDITLVRYGTTGTPDATFGSGGVVVTGIGAGTDRANGVVQQADGQLVVAGTSTNGPNLDFALVRYDSTGMPDASFGTAGHVETPIGTDDDEAFALLLQPNGGLVAAGYSKSGSATGFAVARYLSLSGTTTSTSSTTSTSAVPPTTTTLAGTLVPGGPARKTSSDCYLELRAHGVGAGAVQKSQIVVCVDGDPCDQGACGDDRCDVRLAACASQTDPALPDCTPPASLDSAKLGGALAGETGVLLAGPACTADVTVGVPVKRNRRGSYLARKSKLVIKGKAKAPRGTLPRTDADKWTIQCQPREGACPS